MTAKKTKRKTGKKKAKKKAKKKPVPAERVDKPTTLRGPDNKPVRCRVCGNTFPLVNDGPNIIVELAPRIKHVRKRTIVERVFIHAFCADKPIPREVKTRRAKPKKGKARKAKSEGRSGRSK